MARQLKRWETPRQEGINDKGRGGSARQRQRRKQFKQLRNRLKQLGERDNAQTKTKTQLTGRDQPVPSFFLIATFFPKDFARFRHLPIQSLIKCA